MSQLAPRLRVRRPLLHFNRLNMQGNIDVCCIRSAQVSAAL